MSSETETETTGPETAGRRNTVFHAARGVGGVAAVVAGVAGVLLVLACWSSRGGLPSIAPELDAVMDRAMRSDDAGVVAFARHLDVLARQAYFGGLRFRQLGVGVLVCAVLVGLGAFRLASRLRPTLPRPPADGAQASDGAASAARTALAGVGLVLIVAAVAIGMAPSVSAIREKSVSDDPGEDAAQPDAPGGQTPVSDPRPSEEALAAAWPAFRGHLGCGVASGRDVPLTWDGAGGSNVAWKSAVPLSGMGSPVIWGDRVYVSGGSAERLQVYCFNLETGEPIWAQDVTCEDAGVLELSDDTGFAAPTPATDGQRVYVVFATGDMVAFSLDGKPLWTTSLGLPKIGYGYASSPIAYDGKVYVVFDTEEVMGVMALDAASGQELWFTEREGDPSWTSPVIVQEQDRTVLVACGAPEVAAYALDSGEVLWSVDGVDGEVAPSPAVADGVVVVMQDYSDAVALRLEDGEELWRNGSLDLPDVASPVAYGGRLFLTSSASTLVCVRLADGTPLWDMDLNDACYASPVIVDDRLYILDMAGRMTVLDATTDEARVLAVCELGEGAVATPAFVGDRIVIRGMEHLYCIRRSVANGL